MESNFPKNHPKNQIVFNWTIIVEDTWKTTRINGLFAKNETARLQFSKWRTQQGAYLLREERNDLPVIFKMQWFVERDDTIIREERNGLPAILKMACATRMALQINSTK
jgi:hypothetical protein